MAPRRVEAEAALERQPVMSHRLNRNHRPAVLCEDKRLGVGEGGGWRVRLEAERREVGGEGEGGG